MLTQALNGMSRVLSAAGRAQEAIELLELVEESARDGSSTDHERILTELEALRSASKT